MTTNKNAPAVTEARKRERLQLDKSFAQDVEFVNLDRPIDRVLSALHSHSCNPRQSGSGWTARCPAHPDRDPSLSISEGGGGKVLLNCHAGCSFDAIVTALDLKTSDLFADQPARPGANGRVHGSKAKETVLRVDFEHLIEELHQALRRDEGAQRLLLASRGLTLETAKRYRIGWDSAQRRWSIPVRNAEGLAVGLKYHRSHPGQHPKVLSEPRSSVGLFGADHLLADGSTVVLTEGEFDAAVVWQTSGLCAVSGSGGAATIKKGWLERLHAHPLVSWFDADQAGAEGLAKWLEHLAPAVRNGLIPSVKVVRKVPPDLKDATDCLLRHGPEIIRALIESAELWVPPTEARELTEVHPGPEAKPSEGVRPILVKLSDVEPEEVLWLWEPYLPAGKVTLLEGEPGEGKTTFALQVAAHVSTGRGWPGPDGNLGDRREPGPVLYLSCEDGLSDTIRPRLDRAGGDPTRFTALTGLSNGEPIFLSDHAMVEAAMEEVHPALVVIDPIQGFLGAKVDMHRANEVRPIMARLGNLAEKYACAVVVIRHLRKSIGNHRLHRGMGSIDFVAHARSALRVGRDPNDPDSRGAIHVKASCAAEGPPIGFKITDRGFEWTGTSALSIEVMELGETDRSVRDEAVEFLRSALANGPLPATQILREASELGIAKRTLDRAKRDLGVRVERSGFGPKGGYLWSLH